MYGTIKIGNQEVEMVSNAATPIRFKGVFHTDLLRFFMTMEEGSDPAVATETISQLAFIMALQAKKSDFKNVGENDFITWMEQFEPNDLALAAGDVMNLYSGQIKTESVAKNTDAGPSEK